MVLCVLLHVSFETSVRSLRLLEGACSGLVRRLVPSPVASSPFPVSSCYLPSYSTRFFFSFTRVRFCPDATFCFIHFDRLYFPKRTKSRNSTLESLPWLRSYPVIYLFIFLKQIYERLFDDRDVVIKRNVNTEGSLV